MWLPVLVPLPQTTKPRQRQRLTSSCTRFTPLPRAAALSSPSMVVPASVAVTLDRHRHTKGCCGRCTAVCSCLPCCNCQQNPRHHQCPMLPPECCPCCQQLRQACVDPSGACPAALPACRRACAGLLKACFCLLMPSLLFLC